MMDPWLFLIDVLAVYRLTRLVTKDSLLQEVRWWILRRWPSDLTTFPDSLIQDRQTSDGYTFGTLDTGIPVYLSQETDDDGDPLWKADKVHKITELIECGFCASVWIAFGVTAFLPWHGWVVYVLTSLAVAGVVALIFARVDTES